MLRKDIKTSAILLSRQSMHPCLSSSWVNQTIKAVKWIKKNNFSINTSIGQNTWEIIVFLANENNLKQKIFIPANNTGEFEKYKNDTIEQFNLNTNSNKISFHAVYKKSNKENLLYLRDQQIIFNSDIIIPVSFRNNGHMDTLIKMKKAEKRDSVIDKYIIPYHSGQKKISYKINSRNVTLKTSDFIIHWTRASNGPWPTEKKADYYSSITNAEEYPRSAFCSLINILELKKIKSSTQNMPGKIPTVSFTKLPPEKAIKLMKWRARYRQMTFEPYGIGIDKNYISSLNIQPVIYYDKLHKPENIPLWLCQSRGKKADWSLEYEYRCQGDIDLAQVPDDKIACFCCYPKEVKIINNYFNIKAFSLTNCDNRKIIEYY